MVDLGVYPEWYYSKKADIDTSKLVDKADKALQKAIEDLQVKGKLPMNDSQLKEFTQNLREMMAGIEEEVGDITEKAASQAIKESTQQIAKRSIDLSSFAVPKKAIEELRNQSVELANDTLDKIVDDYRGQIEQGMKDGVGIEQMAADLRDRHDKIADSSLERLARTESHSARQSAKQQNHMVNGVEYKQWWTAEDDRVRDGEDSEFDHTEMHGQITKTGQEFKHPTDGWTLMYPGERHGSYDLANVINCRCTSVPYVPPEGKEQILFSLVDQNGFAYPDELLDYEPHGLDEKGEFATLEEWKDDLSSDEIDAIEDFTGGGYTEIRKLQRGANVSYMTDNKVNQLSSKITNLDKALTRAPKHHGTTYRGMRGLNQEAYQKFSGNVGEQVQFEAFSSTSKKKSIARNFSGRNPDTDIMLEIKGRSGVDIKNISIYGGEEEVLFKKGAKFEIIGEHMDEEMGVRVMEVAEVVD